MSGAPPVPGQPSGERRPPPRSVASLLVAAGVLFAVVLAALPLADDTGGARVDDAFRRALVGYALARGLNGVISVAQGTEVAVQPAGVGVNFAPGEILDPINDLVERFSWIMMLAASSLGVQKVLLSMSAWQGLVLGLALAGALVVASRVFPRLASFAPAFGRVFLFLLLLRFMMPAIAVANDWVYRAFLERDYVEATETLERARERIGDLNEEAAIERLEGAPEGIVDRARSLSTDRRSTVSTSTHGSRRTASPSESVSESTIRLVVVFLMQTIVFPLVFLYVVLGVLRRLARRG